MPEFSFIYPTLRVPCGLFALSLLRLEWSGPVRALGDSSLHQRHPAQLPAHPPLSLLDILNYFNASHNSLGGRGEPVALAPRATVVLQDRA